MEIAVQQVLLNGSDPSITNVNNQVIVLQQVDPSMLLTGLGDRTDEGDSVGPDRDMG